MGATAAAKPNLPLSGIRVLDFGHTVMGPSCTLVLADLGAEVIKIEPVPAGEPTRHLKGFGTGYFGYFNRNKRSIALDLKSTRGRAIAIKLVERADILVENLAPGTRERLGLSPEETRSINQRLIYVRLKGFLDGPYAGRLALDEVVQMMSGLAYMTGPSGRPLRVGTSVVDITGGIFAVIGILTAMRQREATGSGSVVESALFESAVFLMGQHLCYAAQSEEKVPPMPERVSAWAIYEAFTLSDGKQFFLGITTDKHWERFCQVFDRQDLLASASLATNNQRIAARAMLIPIIQAMMAKLTIEEASEKCEEARIPFAPIARPEDLFDDPHLQATGALMTTRLPNGIETTLPRLPMALEGVDFSVRLDPPRAGEHTIDILTEIGLTNDDVSALLRDAVVSAPAGKRSHPEAAGDTGTPLTRDSATAGSEGG